MKVKVLFVCLGNICRSPTAEGVFQKLVNEVELKHKIHVDSAGTANWHEGKSPDARTVAAAKKRGVELADLRARGVTLQDFYEFDYILAMDESNLAHLQKMKPDNFSGTLALFLSYGEQTEFKEVPDPYYGGADGFELVLDLVEDAASGLLDTIKQHRLT